MKMKKNKDRRKAGTTLVETMVTLLLIMILLTMAAGSLSSAFRIFLKIQKTQYAQSVLDTAMTELRTLTANASGYVKIYADGNEITDKEGIDTGTGTALEFLNEEGYAVLLSTDGCKATDIYITGSRTGEVEAVEQGQLLVRYYFPTSGKYVTEKGSTPVARAVTTAFGSGFYMGDYLEITYSFPAEITSGKVSSVTATLKLYADAEHTEELASDTEILSFRRELTKKSTVTAIKEAASGTGTGEGSGGTGGTGGTGSGSSGTGGTGGTGSGSSGTGGTGSAAGGSNVIIVPEGS